VGLRLISVRRCQRKLDKAPKTNIHNIFNMANVISTVKLFIALRMFAPTHQPACVMPNGTLAIFFSRILCHEYRYTRDKH
jgi:hypothetical protein